VEALAVAGRLAEQKNVRCCLHAVTEESRKNWVARCFYCSGLLLSSGFLL